MDKSPQQLAYEAAVSRMRDRAVAIPSEPDYIAAGLIERWQTPDYNAADCPPTPPLLFRALLRLQKIIADTIASDRAIHAVESEREINNYLQQILKERALREQAIEAAEKAVAKFGTVHVTMDPLGEDPDRVFVRFKKDARKPSAGKKRKR